MRTQDASLSLEILVNGRDVREYYSQGDTWIEGRDGSEFTIRIRNHTGARILAMLSVDGLSVLTGKPADMYSDGGYIVPAYGYTDVNGWRLDNDTIAKFLFGAKRDSYSAQSGKGTTNVGVIGVAAYREHFEPPKVVHIWPTTYVYPIPVIPYTPPTVSPWKPCDYPYDITWTSNVSDNYTLSCNADSVAAFNTPPADGNVNTCFLSASSTPTLGCHVDGWDEDGNFGGAVKRGGEASKALRSLRRDAVPVQQELGTEFGRAATDHVRDVDFTKAHETPDWVLSIRYDSLDNLRKRGVLKTEPVVCKKPNPFPGSGCTPPSGWCG